jgi:hypothetical protein
LELNLLLYSLCSLNCNLLKVIVLIIISRGVSWSVGGDGTLATTTTLANIFKKYNPKIRGNSDELLSIDSK